MSPILTLDVLAGWIYNCTDGSERKRFTIFKLTPLHTRLPVEFLCLPPATCLLAASCRCSHPAPARTFFRVGLGSGQVGPSGCPVTGTASSLACCEPLPVVLSTDLAGGDFVPENRREGIEPSCAHQSNVLQALAPGRTRSRAPMHCAHKLLC